MMRQMDTIVHLRRPVTPASIGDVLGVKPFELMRHLTGLEVFAAPHQHIDDVIVHALGKIMGVTFEIEDEGGEGTRPEQPSRPIPPPPLQGRKYLRTLFEDPESPKGLE